MKPIDLRELAVTTYKTERDPAAKFEPGGRKDHWLLVIPCRKGHIYPHSDKLLGLYWESSARLDKKCPARRLYQDGDVEKTYLFKPEHFERVAELAGAKKRRKLSPLNRQVAIQRLRPFQKS